MFGCSMSNKLNYIHYVYMFDCYIHYSQFGKKYNKNNLICDYYNRSTISDNYCKMCEVLINV